MSKPSLTSAPAEPAAVACTITEHNGVWMVVTEPCPYCGKVHVHGAGPSHEVPMLGHRAAHCINEPATTGYILIPRPQS
jgi:hypothetical protein